MDQRCHPSGVERGLAHCLIIGAQRYFGPCWLPALCCPRSLRSFSVRTISVASVRAGGQVGKEPSRIETLRYNDARYPLRDFRAEARGKTERNASRPA